MNILDSHAHVESIYHLSDIHIRLYHRLDDEYQHVFQQMYALLQTSKQEHEKCVIVLTGDILHNKNDLSPECILTTLKFLNTLSSYYPTFFIAGNHDALLNNLDRTDSLSAILAENQNNRLYYLKHSGYYQYGNILFGVSSLLDNQMTPIGSHKTSPLRKVALYHGGVGRFSTNKGFIMEGIPCNTFDGYDMVMLGDIHLHQYLDKERRIAYAGSMIAQNFGETDKEHGVLKWNIETGDSYHITLENPYRYCEATLTDNGMMMDGVFTTTSTIELPSHGRLKLLIQKENAYHDVCTLQKRFPLVQITEMKVNKKDTMVSMSTPSTKSQTLDLLEDYFSDLSWSERDSIKQQVLSILTGSQTTMTLGNFEILFVEFHYMFGYGASNRLDFSKFERNQTIGIFGMNSAGKSTLIDIICFLLFGVITRYRHGVSIPHEVIHFQQNKSSGMIRFRSHNITYEIHKKMTRLKTKIRVDERLLKISTDGITIDLSEEHRRKTDKFVISQIGTPSQFLFTNVFLQSNENSFRSMSPKERKEFLFDILQLSSLENYYQEQYSQWKNNKFMLEQLDKELRSLHVDPQYLEILEEMVKQLQSDKEKCTEKISLLQQEIRLLLSQKKSSCPSSLRDEDIHQMEQELIMYQQALDSMERVDIPKEELHQTLEKLYCQILPIPELCLSLSSFQKYDLCPSIKDMKTFRQEVYNRFQNEYDSVMRHTIQNESELVQQKEYLLSQLHRVPCISTDTLVLEKQLQTLISDMKGDRLDEIKKTQQEQYHLEETMLSLKTEWEKKWKEWETLEPPSVIQNLHFDKKCSCCLHNQHILNVSLREEILEKKQRLWQEIAPSKDQYLHLQQEDERIKKKIVILKKEQEDYLQVKEQVTLIQKTLENRLLEQQIEKLQKEIQESRHNTQKQKDFIEMKTLWESLKRFVIKLQQIVDHNNAIEDEIQKQKEMLLKVEKRDRNIRKIAELQSHIQEWTQEKKNIEHNRKLDKKIQKREEKEIHYKQQLEENLNQWLQKKQELTQLQHQELQKKEKETLYQQTKEEQQLLEKILQVVHRDGLPLYLLEQSLPQLERRINELIQPFLKEKKVVLRKEQKKESMNIVLSISTLGSETTYVGGMEGFIVDAAIKEVLAEASLQCKSNFFMIDEGISALDKKQMEHLDQFFHFLEERHAHVFIISHLQQAQHLVRHSLHICKDEQQYSNIVYH